MFTLPKTTILNRFVPKKTFEQKVPNGKKILNDIVKITIKNKIAPSTINIEATPKIPEILLFEIVLKNKEIPKNAIKTIDELVNIPILYKLIFEDSFCYAIFYKEGKKYFFSDWNETKEFDFSYPNLQKVYEEMVKSFFRSDAKKIENNFAKSFEIELQIEILAKEIQALENKITKEKQFKKKLELSQKLTPKQNQLQTILKEINE